MNNIYIIFYLINIFATQLHAASISATNMYDVVSTNFSKTCPTLSNNVLANSTTKYLSNCKDVSIVNPPEQIDIMNLNIFYCIGMLAAEMQLCNLLSNYDYQYLPKSFEDLDQQIGVIQKTKPAYLCSLLKEMELFNDTKIIPPFSKTVTVLKEELNGPNCTKLCWDYMAGDNTNVLCSLMYLLNSHISNVSKAIAQQKPLVLVSKMPTKLATVKAVHTEDDKKMTVSKSSVDKNVPLNTQPSEISTDETTRDVGTVNPKPDLVPPSIDVKLDANPAANPNPQIQPNEPGDKTGNPTSVPDLHPVATEEKSGQPQAPDNPTKNIQAPIEHGEDQSKQTLKPVEATNETPKDTKTNVDKSREPVLADEKDYPTTSTEINFMKPHFETVDDYNDDNDDDEDESMKMNDDTNPIAAKVQEDLMNSRADINPNIKQIADVDVEESNFFSYFMFISVMFIAGYVVYHNKQKIMALILEGRKDRNSRRRPSTSSYRKLNSNLEEAVTSKCSGSASHVIY